MKEYKDYYESKRSKYDIEKSIYEYAKKMGVNEEFYVFITLPFEKIIYSGIDKSPKKILIWKKEILAQLD